MAVETGSGTAAVAGATGVEGGAGTDGTETAAAVVDHASKS
ncbi:MAG TPA: hypothetical protein VFA17_10935 [Thermoplasmata archaeon]|nr:hypothetical protein [Thermoplasmata archaeon]